MGLGVAGLALWLWAVLHPGFRDAQGSLITEVCLVIAAGAAAILLALGVRGRALAAAAWGSLALVGQAAALQLVAAGPLVGYQHYRPVTQLLAAPQSFLTAVIAGQFVLVALGLRAHWPDVLRYAQLIASRWQWVVGIAAMVLTSATLSRDPMVYLTELGFAGAIQLINLGTVVLAVSAIPAHHLARFQSLGRRLLGKDGTSRIDGYAIGVVAWVVLVAVLLSVVAYERHPHVPDEVGYLLHAKYFAEGLLTMPLPPSIDAFDVHLMTYTAEEWYSPVPPGWPAMLAVGAYFRAAWLVNPLLAGLNVYLAYVLTRHLYDRKTARLVITLVAVSPWFLYMAANFLTHTFTLTCGLVGAVALSTLRRTHRIRWGWLAGAAIGAASLVRPLDGLAMAVLLGLWALFLRGRRIRFAPVAAVVLGAVLVGGIQLWYNQRITGDAGTFPLMAFMDSVYGPGTNALGFGPDRGSGWKGLDPLPGHGPLDVLINANINGFAVNIELFGWSTGSLLFLILLVLRGRFRRADWFMLGWIGIVVGIHSFYYFSGGPDFGARYWFLIVIPSIVLTVRSIEELALRLTDRTGSVTVGVRVGMLAVALSIAAMVNFVPWRAIDKYWHYRGMRADIRRLAVDYEFGRSIVFVRGRRSPDYASAVVYNSVDLESDAPIYAYLPHAGVRKPVTEAFPGRPVWVVDGPTLTGAGYRVVAGPLTATEFLSDTTVTSGAVQPASLDADHRETSQ